MGATYRCYGAGEEGGGWVPLIPRVASGAGGRSSAKQVHVVWAPSRSVVGACWATLAGRHAGHLGRAGVTAGRESSEPKLPTETGHQLDSRRILDVR